MATKTAPTVRKRRGSPSQHRSFFYYIAPDGVQTEQLVARGLLPLRKKQVKDLRARGSLPNPADQIIVLRTRLSARKSLNVTRHDLVSLCQVVLPEKQTDPSNRIAPDLSRAFQVTEVSVGKANQRSRAKVPILEGNTTRPALLPASKADWNKALSRFPLLMLGKEIARLASKTKVFDDSLDGYLYDLRSRRLCGISEWLSSIDDSLLEKAMVGRVASKEGYEMACRLHTLAMQARGTNLRSMSWQELEDACVKLVESYGFSVNPTKLSSDGGVDFYAEDRNAIFGRGVYVFQVKHTDSVGVKVVRELFAVVDKSKAIKGVILTSGNFTGEAIREAEWYLIELVDGAKLSELLEKYRSVLPDE